MKVSASVSMMDQGDYIYMVTDSVIENLIIGGLLAIVVLILFLMGYKANNCYSL
jgi:multidrug efflux pump subunit AcrB